MMSLFGWINFHAIKSIFEKDQLKLKIRKLHSFFVEKKTSVVIQKSFWYIQNTNRHNECNDVYLILK